MKKNIEIVQRVELLKKISAGRRVLHLGCTNYPYTREAMAGEMLLHTDLEKVAKELYGFDFDPAGLEILKRSGVKNLFQADLEKLEEVGLEETFEVIIAGEIIEHLLNPGIFLQGIKKFMQPETQLVITTVNAYCAMRFLIYALRGKGGLNEPVHPDHVAYYSYRTLKLLIEKNNLVLKEFYFYDLGQEHRPYNRLILNLFNDICVKISPQMSDGVIAICGLEGGEG